MGSARGRDASAAPDLARDGLTLRYRALCCDYDGTLAVGGRVAESTVAALEAVKESGRRLLLVTGRELSDLARVFVRSELFDRIVAENGAVLARPAEGTAAPLADPPPPSFVDALRSDGVAPLSVGRVIVATTRENEARVAAAVARLHLPLALIPNKDALMVLPRGVDKASGLARALAELALSPAQAVGIGDAENDLAFLTACGFSAAVANALPAVKNAADLVLAGESSQGVEELVRRLLSSELDARPPGSGREGSALSS